MAKCPACDHEVRTPAFYNLEGWSNLACAQCKTRLEMKPRLVAVWVLPILTSMSLLARKGHIYSVIAEVLLVSSMTAIVLALIIRPRVRLRKRPQPKPDISLNIDVPPN